MLLGLIPQIILMTNIFFWHVYYYLFVAAMNQLTKNLACEWAKDNIRSNCVLPWTTRTPLFEPVMFLYSCFSKSLYYHIYEMLFRF